MALYARVIFVAVRVDFFLLIISIWVINPTNKLKSRPVHRRTINDVQSMVYQAYQFKNVVRRSLDLMPYTLHVCTISPTNSSIYCPTPPTYIA